MIYRLHFFLARSFLGLLKPATIGGVAVHVVLPDVSESGNETVLHPRAVPVDWVGSFAEKKRRTIRDGRSAKSMDGETNGSYQLRGFWFFRKTALRCAKRETCTVQRKAGSNCWEFGSM